MRASRLHAWLFDLDGVLTDTARVHAEAWKATFDTVQNSVAPSGPPFDPVADYVQFVDGRPRLDGVRAFLGSRGIELPVGDPADPPGDATAWAVGNAKNALYLELLKVHPADVFPDAVELVQALRRAGKLTAVVSASENCVPVLDATGLTSLFDTVVDGKVAAAQHLAGRPAPDTYLWAAKALDVHPAMAAVVDDAPAGIAAGHVGGFGFVVGVARRATRDQLLEAGAHVAVTRLDELEMSGTTLDDEPRETISRRVG